MRPRRQEKFCQSNEVTMNNLKIIAVSVALLGSALTESAIAQRVDDDYRSGRNYNHSWYVVPSINVAE